MKEAVYISDNAISLLFELQFPVNDSAKPIEVDFNLQIGQIVYHPCFNEKFYSLCDLSYYYPNFIFSHSERGKSIFPEFNDIIKVQLVSSYYDNQHKARVFVIHLFQTIGTPPFSALPYTKEYKPQNNSNEIVYLDNEPLSHYYNLINHLSSLPINATLFIKVVTKTPLITYKNNKGMFFFFDIIDQENTKLRVVAFNSTAQLFYSMININSYYQIKGSFAKQKGNYKTDDELEEIYLSNESEIIEITNKKAQCDNQSNAFHSIQFVLSACAFCLVNIIGKVIKVTNAIYSKSKDSIFGMRTISIFDSSGYKVDVQLWNHYTLYLIRENDIVALYNIQIKQYESSKLLSAVSETKIVVNPKNREANAFAFYLNNSKGILNNRITALNHFSDLRINEVRVNDHSLSSHQFNNSDIRIKGIVASVTHSNDNYYEGCNDLSCKGRVINDDFNLKCSKCESKQTFVNYYYSFHIIIKDSTGAIEAILINKAAYDFLGINASEYKDQFEAGKQYILSMLTERNKFKLFYFYSKVLSTKPLEITQIEEVNQLKESRLLMNKIKSALQNNKFSV